jgi:hypothetical protein
MPILGVMASLFKMTARLGVGDAFIGEPVAQHVEGLDPQPRGKSRI